MPHYDHAVTLTDAAGNAINLGNPLPTTGASGGGITRGSVADHSTTIAAGNTSQVLMGANSSRTYLFIQNVSDGDLWFNYGIAAVLAKPSIKIPVDGNYENPAHFVSDQAINIIGATTGQAFVAKEG